MHLEHRVPSFPTHLRLFFGPKAGLSLATPDETTHSLAKNATRGHPTRDFEIQRQDESAATAWVERNTSAVETKPSVRRTATYEPLSVGTRASKPPVPIWESHYGIARLCSITVHSRATRQVSLNRLLTPSTAWSDQTIQDLVRQSETSAP